MAAASGIEPDSDSLTARRIALMLDRKNKWSRAGESNSVSQLGRLEPSQWASPAQSSQIVKEHPVI